MVRSVRIPVRIVQPKEGRSTPGVEETKDSVTHGQEMGGRTASATTSHGTFAPEPTPEPWEVASVQDARSPQPATGREAAVPSPETPVQGVAPPGFRAEEPPAEPDAASLVPRADVDEWRDRALRLQADMDNYRRRQRRSAQAEIKLERQRLLRGYLGVIDDLDRALLTTDDGDASLRQGIELTRRGALQFLQKEGVEKIEARGQAFDPTWHEAVATVGRNGLAPNRDTVVQVVESGYRLGDQLLRPAKVVVAI